MPIVEVSCAGWSVNAEVVKKFCDDLEYILAIPFLSPDRREAADGMLKYARRTGAVSQKMQWRVDKWIDEIQSSSKMSSLFWDDPFNFASREEGNAG